MSGGCSVRPMRWEDVPQVVEVWRETGLSEGTHSLHTWFRFDPDGFFVLDDGQGEVLGVCAAINLHARLAFVGLYAVRRSHRGRGLGQRLWTRAMEHVGGRNAGLNSVPEHLRTYRDLAGFGVLAPWRTLFCEGVPDFSQSPVELEGVQIVPIRATVLPAVINYDASVHGYDRSKLVTLTASEEDSVSLAAVRTGTRRVCGYGSLRRDVQEGGLLAGPLYADNADVAENLLRHLAAQFPGEERRLAVAVAGCNQAAVRLAVDRLKLAVGVEVPRCYTREEVRGDFERVFGQHALNFSPI